MAPGEWRLAATGALLLALGLGLISAGLVLAEERQAPLLQLTIDRSQDVRPVWSPDGKRVAFQSDRDGGQYQIWTMNSDGSDPRQLSHEESDDRHPIYSPDGTQLAFDSGTNVSREIWLMNADGSSRHQLTRLDAFASFPSWSADSRELAFYTYKAGVTDLWTVAADGTGVRQLTKGLADERKSNCTNACHRPSWSPDGSTIAISGGDHRTVWTVDVNSTAMTQITDGAEHAHFPWYLPDGRLAWVVEYIQQGGEAYTDVVAADPATPTATQVLLKNVSVQGPYEISADGQRVLFHSPRAGNFDIYVADTAASGGLAALQTSRSSADIAAGVPTPVPDPALTSSRAVVAIDPASGSTASHPVPQAVAAAPVVPEPPPNLLLPIAVTGLIMLGVAAALVTTLQIMRRRRR
jgi:Tol biopolymer transport system component